MTRDTKMKKTMSNSYLLRDPTCSSVTPSICQLYTQVSGRVVAFLSQGTVTGIPRVLTAQKWQAWQRLTHKTKMEVNGKLNIAINRQNYYLSFRM